MAGGKCYTVDRSGGTSLLARLYLPAILAGLGVTGRHFFVQLWGFLSGKPKIFTVQYPEERIALPASFRGQPVLVQTPDGNERCVACGLCEFICPTDCITIYPAEKENGIERYPETFTIDMSRCCWCGLCEEACPEEAIVMSQRFELATFSRAGTLYKKQDLLVPEEDLKPRLEFLRRGYGR